LTVSIAASGAAKRRDTLGLSIAETTPICTAKLTAEDNNPGACFEFATSSTPAVRLAREPANRLSSPFFVRIENIF
jgi:hypothetical protein